jgi:cell wall-associated NlpC family hydrolase
LRRWLTLAAALLALALPAAASAGDTFVVLPDQTPGAPTPSTSTPSGLPSAFVPNAPGDVTVNADFTTPPLWVEQLSVDQLRPIWERAGAAYGIPWQVLAAIDKVESNFGQNMGPSSAGAVGWMQFMPDTWLRWGVDANGDGVADPWNPDDAIYAAARYLAASGGATDIASAVYSYNHASWYVSEVLSLATVYAGGTIDASPLGAPVVDVTAAQQRVAAVTDSLMRAQQAEQQLTVALAHAQRHLDRTRLLSDQLLAQKQVTLVGIRYDRAHADAGRLRSELAQAKDTLGRARASAFAAPLQLMGTPALPAGATLSADAFGSQTSPGASQALNFALSKLGTPYLWGGEGSGGFDCSGLVQAAYASAGITLPRVAQDQFDAGPLLPPGEPLQAGDLVFFGSDASHVEHVGIVGAPGLMIDAPHTGAVVRFDGYERGTYVGATRPAATQTAVDAAAPTGDVAAGRSSVFAFAPNTAGSPSGGEILFTKNP